MQKIFRYFISLFLVFIFVKCSNNQKSNDATNDKSYYDTPKPKEIINTNNMASEQAVIITFNYGIHSLDSLHSLEERLEKTIKENQLGEYDGHEIAVDYSDGFLYMYGPSAEKLFKGIKPILEQTSFMKGANVKLRFGPPEDGVKEIDIQL